MATEATPETEPDRLELIRPPVEGGTGYVESLGKFIDDLMGHSKIERRVNEELADFVVEMNSQPPDESQEESKPLPDPPSTEPPPPVPDGTGTEEKGGEPGETRPIRPDKS